MRISRVFVFISAALIVSAAVAITVSCEATGTNGNNSRCATVKPKPLSVNQVTKTLKASGYRVEMEPDECAAPETVMVLSLTPKADDKATALCYIDKSPQYGDGVFHLTVGTWVNRNVTCAIIPSNLKHAQMDYVKLRRATKQLSK